MRDAALVQVGERVAVRLVRQYPVAASWVWAAVGEPNGLSRWFPSPCVSFDPRAGAAMTFSGDPHAPEAVTHGQLRAYEPGSSIRFTWGDDELWFDVTPLGEETRFTLTNVLGQHDTAARAGAGWTVCLAALDASMGDSTEGETDWRSVYDTLVERGFPHGAPIPGE